MIDRTDYGMGLGGELTQRQIEALCFIGDRQPEVGGLGSFGHFKRFIGLVWPQAVHDTRWNPWTEQRFSTMFSGLGRSGEIGSRFTNMSWTGCAAAGKSHDAAVLSLAWFAMAPKETTVMYCSTSKQMIRRRMWPTLQEFYNTMQDGLGSKWEFGHMLESRTVLQSEYGDDKHAIYGLAVERRELHNSIGTLKGVHSPRMMLIIDEAETTPLAIFETIPNMRKGCRDFILLIIGNAVTQIDPHGQICEPRRGWDGVSVESDGWDTKAIDKWNIDPGYCMHFDGKKSPNVLLGKNKWPFLYRCEDWAKAQANKNYHDSPHYWSHERGWWAPEGAFDRIITPQMIIKNNARSQFTWVGSAERVAAFDPAWGGDRAILQFGTLGDIEQGDGKIVKGLQIDEFLEATPKVRSPDELDYQMAEKCIEESKSRGIVPGRFGMDATGAGRGIAGIMSREWAGGPIVRLEFGAAPSERPLIAGDARPAKELFTNFVTELWWAVREFLCAGMLRGFYDEASRQFVGRPYEVYAGKKYKLISKEECVKEVGHSPDHADAVAILVEVARRNGLSMSDTNPKQSRTHWKTIARKADAMYRDVFASAA